MTEPTYPIPERCDKPRSGLCWGPIRWLVRPVPRRLARCNGAEDELSRAADSSLDAFRSALKLAATTPREPVLIMSYDRAVLGQTGHGHFCTSTAPTSARQ